MTVLSQAGCVPVRPWRRWKRSVVGLLANGVEAFCGIFIECAGLVALVAFLCGMVLVVQSAGELARYGAAIYVVKIVTVTLLRELAPVLTGILAAGLVGASVVAHTGSMAASDQIDAMRNLGIPVEATLLWPRLLGGPPALLAVCAVFNVAGLLGAAASAHWMHVLSFRSFLALAAREACFYDLAFGWMKAYCFGLAVVLVAVEIALRVRPSEGGRGVARATTRAVFWASAAVMGLDFVLSHVFFLLGPMAHLR